MATRDARSFAKSERPRAGRSRLINFKVTDAEYERIRENAERERVSVSAMLRARGLGEPRATRYIEVHVPEAGEVAAQVNAMRLELADEGRNLTAIVRELKRASDSGTLGRGEAARAMRQVMSCETWLRAVEGGLDRVKPLSTHVMMRFEGDDFERHRNPGDAARYVAEGIEDGGRDGDD